MFKKNFRGDAEVTVGGVVAYIGLHRYSGAAFMISVPAERLFKDIMASYRRAIPVEALSDADIALIERSEVQTDTPYDLENIPDIEDAPPPSR